MWNQSKFNNKNNEDTDVVFGSLLLTLNEFLMYCSVISIVNLEYVFVYWANSEYSQPAVICSKLTIGTSEQGVKYVQS